MRKKNKKTMNNSIEKNEKKLFLLVAQRRESRYRFSNELASECSCDRSYAFVTLATLPTHVYIAPYHKRARIMLPAVVKYFLFFLGYTVPKAVRCFD